MNKVQNIIDSQMDTFTKAIENVQSEYLKKVKSMIDKFETIDNAILANSENTIALLADINNLQEALIESGFDDLVLKELVETGKISETVYSGIPKGLIPVNLSFGKIEAETLKNILAAKFKSLEDIGSDAVKEVRQLLTESIIKGMDKTELVSMVESKIDTNLKRYAETYVNTAKQEFAQFTENVIADEIEFDGIWKYIGAPLQTNSHLECIWALNTKANAPYFTNEEKIAFESGSAYSGQPNPPRYNCQHRFIMTEITKEEYEKS